jgi:hypothetical protein
MPELLLNRMGQQFPSLAGKQAHHIAKPAGGALPSKAHLNIPKPNHTDRLLRVGCGRAVSG